MRSGWVGEQVATGDDGEAELVVERQEAGESSTSTGDGFRVWVHRDEDDGVTVGGAMERCDCTVVVERDRGGGPLTPQRLNATGAAQNDSRDVAQK